MRAQPVQIARFTNLRCLRGHRSNRGAGDREKGVDSRPEGDGGRGTGGDASGRGAAGTGAVSGLGKSTVPNPDIGIISLLCLFCKRAGRAVAEDCKKGRRCFVALAFLRQSAQMSKVFLKRAVANRAYRGRMPVVRLESTRPKRFLCEKDGDKKRERKR